jgi:hypothetical protein
MEIECVLTHTSLYKRLDYCAYLIKCLRCRIDVSSEPFRVNILYDVYWTLFWLRISKFLYEWVTFDSDASCLRWWCAFVVKRNISGLHTVCKSHSYTCIILARAHPYCKQYLNFMLIFGAYIYIYIYMFTYTRARAHTHTPPHTHTHTSIHTYILPSCSTHF